MKTKPQPTVAQLLDAEREVIDTVMKWAEIDFGYDADAEKAVERACGNLRKMRARAEKA